MSVALQVRGRAGGGGLWRKIAIALAAAALASGVATYLALTGAPPIGPRPNVVLSLLYLDLVLLLLLASLVAKRLVEVWLERRRVHPRLAPRLRLVSCSASLPCC
jgi:two-component system nitrogen regulation sensor histidine kinase NtrY